MERMSSMSMIIKVKEHIGFHYFFDFFGIEYILEKVLNKIKDNSITHKTPRIQDNDSIM